MNYRARSAPTDIRSKLKLSGGTQVLSRSSQRSSTVIGHRQHTSDKFTPHNNNNNNNSNSNNQNNNNSNNYNFKLMGTPENILPPATNQIATERYL